VQDIARAISTVLVAARLLLDETASSSSFMSSSRGMGIFRQ